MKIYRLETEDNIGIYSNKSTSRIINDGRGEDHRWQMPWDDAKLQEQIQNKEVSSFTNKIIKTKVLEFWDRSVIDKYDHRDYVFGFRSKSQMKRWVCKKKWRQEFADKNILLNIYEIDPKYVMIGSSQCTFFHEKATLIESVSPTHFG